MTGWRTLLARYLPGYRRHVAALAGVSTAAGVAEAATLVILVQVAVAVAQGDAAVGLDLPIFSDALRLRTAVAIALFGAVAVGVLHLATNAVAARTSATVLVEVRARALRAYGNASWDRQAREAEGSLHESVGTLASNAWQLVLSTSHALSALLTLGAFIVGALLIAPAATGIVVVAGVALFAMLRPMSRASRRRSRVWTAANTAFNQRVAQMSSLGFELRSFGVDGHQVDSLIDEANRVAVPHRASMMFQRLGMHLYRDLALVMLVGAVALLEAVDTVDLAAVGSVVLLMLRSLASAQDINGAIHSIQHQLPTLELLDERVTDLEADSNPVGQVRVDGFERIELRGLTYRYEPDSAAVLDGVDLTLHRGEMLGVVGPSGGGKSTLVQVLLRLRFGEGEVLVDDVPLVDVDAASWQQLAAVVPQAPRLVTGTIAENIAFFRDIPHDEVVEAAKLANLADEIAELPAGFDTVLGPRGSGLSGGQSQRLAIARALVGRPRLLILDEPTSALDVHSEAALQATIDGLAGDVTMVIIAHRLSTIAACDRLLILDRGRVAAVGTPDEVRDHPFLKDRLTT